MFSSHIGEIAALACAFMWTICAISFEFAGKKVGSLAVNYIRLIFGLIFLSLYTLLFRGHFLPTDASGHAWLWLSISGAVGFAIGDLLLFEAFVVMGARISMLVMSSVPVITAIIGWFFLHEMMTLLQIVGMLLTVLGIASVVLVKQSGQKIRLNHPVKGILLAFGGAAGQSVGLIFSKYGMGQYDAFAATQIRVIAGLISFSIIFTIMNNWGSVFRAFRHHRAMFGIIIGAFTGPFLGVAFSLIAVQQTQAGIASTIIAIQPILIIPVSAAFFKEKVNGREILGALIAIGGIALLFV